MNKNHARALARAMLRAALKTEMTTTAAVGTGPETALGSIPSSHPLGKKRCPACEGKGLDCKCPNVEPKV